MQSFFQKLLNYQAKKSFDERLCPPKRIVFFSLEDKGVFFDVFSFTSKSAGSALRPIGFQQKVKVVNIHSVLRKSSIIFEAACLEAPAGPRIRIISS